MAGKEGAWDQNDQLSSQGLVYWSAEILGKMREAGEEVVKEESQRDSDFRRVYASYSDFRSGYAIWRKYGYLK